MDFYRCGQLDRADPRPPRAHGRFVRHLGAGDPGLCLRALVRRTGRGMEDISPPLPDPDACDAAVSSYGRDHQNGHSRRPPVRQHDESGDGGTAGPSGSRISGPSAVAGAAHRRGADPGLHLRHAGSDLYRRSDSDATTATTPGRRMMPMRDMTWFTLASTVSAALVPPWPWVERSVRRWTLWRASPSRKKRLRERCSSDSP